MSRHVSGLGRAPKARVTISVLAVFLLFGLVGIMVQNNGDSVHQSVPGAPGLQSGSGAGDEAANTGGDGSAANEAQLGAAFGQDANASDGTGASDGDDAQSAVGRAAGAQVSFSTQFDRKVIRSATIALTVGDVEQSLSFVRDTAIGAGGFVFSSSTSYQGEREYGQIVVQVPFAQFDGVMNQLRKTPGLDRVENETTTGQDVTTEYVDTESRIRNLEATEQSYLTLLGKATNVEDILLVQDRLTDTRGEIETLQGRLKYLDSVTAYSSITVSIAPVIAAPAEEPVSAENAFVRAARGAWEASLAIVAGIAIGIIAVLAFSWWLVLGGLGVYIVLRRRRGRTNPDLAVSSGPPATGAV